MKQFGVTVVFTMAGLGSKYRLLVGAFDKVAEPTRLVKRAVAAAGSVTVVGLLVPMG